MKYFSIFLLLFLIANALASEVSVITTNEREILLKGKDCSKLKKSEEDILSWTEKVDGLKPERSKCFCKNTDCTINVTQSVPFFAKKWQGVISKILSGNCWNTMFRANGILPSIRMSYPEELRFLLNSPTICKERPVSEPNQSGDMILIRTNQRSLNESEREIHGFVYINDELAFQKEGPGAGEPIEVVESRYAFENITNPVCKKVDGNPPTDPQVANSCQLYANVYSCSSLKEVMKNKNDQIGKLTTEKLNQIDGLECHLQNYNNSPLSIMNMNSLHSLEGSFEVLKKWAEENSTNSQNEFDAFLINYILNRADSSIKHIHESAERINEVMGSGKVGTELDKDVEDSERKLADKYAIWKDQIDVCYELLDFSNKYKRLPTNDLKSSSEEKAFFLRLKEFDLFTKIQNNPEQFEIYLHPDVYRVLIKKNQFK